MSKTLKNTFAGFIVALVAVGMTAAPALALDPAIEALLISLGVPQSVIDQIDGGSTGSTSTSTQATGYVYTGLLQRGSTGSSVAALQEALNKCYSAGLVVDGVFGLGTKSAVMSVQSSKGLVADGVVGPASAPHFESCMVTVVTPDTDSSDDSDDSDDSSSSSDSVDDGSEGSVKSYSMTSRDETEALEGEEDVEIYVAEVELDDEGDLLLERVDVWFANADSASADDDPWEYFESIALTVDGKVVASEDADSSSDWSDKSDGEIGGVATANEYRMRFSGIETVLESDSKAKIGIEVSMVNTIDSADQDAIWYVEIDDDAGFKFSDGTGFVFTEGAGGTTLEESFTVGNEQTARMDLSVSSDDPDASVIAVDDSSDTADQTIAVYNVEEKENIDVTIDTITVGLTVTDPGGGVTITNASSVIKKLTLEVGGNEIGSESVGTGLTPTVTFDNLDWDLDGEDDEDVTIIAEFEDTNNSARYDNGTTVQVTSFAITELDDANGNDEGEITTITTPGAGNTHELRDEGIMVSFDDSSFTKTTSDTTGIDETVEFTLDFDVTAFGEDMWIERTCAVGTTGTDVDAIEVSLDGDTDGSSTTCTDFDTTSGATQGTDGFEVKKGTTESFRVTILGNGGEAASAGTAVTFKARLNGVGFNVQTDAVGDTVYAFDMTDYESTAVSVFDR